MTHIVSIINQKGGVGKTTLSINLGAALSRLGNRVLLIDFDSQGHLTEGVGLADLYVRDSPTLHEALVDGDIPLRKLIVKVEPEGFSVIPSNYQLVLTDQALFMARNREHRLRGLLAPISDQFDWILIDCPPALSNLTDNALNAGREVIIPIQAEATSVRALELLFDQIESIERGLDISIRILAVVPNLVQDSVMARETLAELRRSISVLAPIEIRKRVILQEAWRAGRSIFTFDVRSSAQASAQQELKVQYLHLARIVTDNAADGVPNV